MSSSSEYWKHWWNEQARTASSDFALNRRTAVRIDPIEKHAVEQLLTAVAPRPADAILDAGCGSGRNISILAPHVDQIIGVDYSDEMLVRAGQRIRSENLSNARLLRADVTQLPFAANSFDAVVCASVLQYLDDAECAVAIHELVRVTKPGGRLVLHIKNGTSLYGLSLGFSRLVSRLIDRPTKPEHYRPRRWHEQELAAADAQVTDCDGFGIFTFVPLPRRVVTGLLQLEAHVPIPRRMRQFAVNYQMTIRVDKRSRGQESS
jgi:SAM-dependent methyltransferase